MAYDLRTLLDGYKLVEISNRTLHGRHLLRPCRQLNAIVTGALARAQRNHGVLIHAYVVLSNHYHLLASFSDAQQMADFVRDFQAKIAKEVAQLYGWRTKIWAQRYDHIPVDPSDADQIQRLRYLLANGSKEGLVNSPLEWPGASAAKALYHGRNEIRGLWIDRTGLCRARQRRTAVDPRDFHQTETLLLSPLPCWQHLTPEAYRLRLVEMIDAIARETRRQHRRNHTRPLGVRRILRHDPLQPTELTERRPKPRVHALKRAAREAFLFAYRAVVLAYRNAAQRLRRGHPQPGFPTGCFPPGLPFVTS